MRTERWWWIAAFFTISILIHIFLALHGPGFGIKMASVAPEGIELKLEPLPVEKKRPAPIKAPKVPPKIVKAPRQIIEKKQVVPKVVVKPVEKKPMVTPQIRVARLLPIEKPRVALMPHTVAPETMPEHVLTRPAFTPRHTTAPMKLAMANPLSSMTTVNDAPQIPTANPDSHSVLHAPPTRPTLAITSSSVTTQTQVAVDQPQDQPTNTKSSIQFPKVASRLGGVSVMAVNNPLAEDAVPNDAPGVGTAHGATSGPSSFAPSVRSASGKRGNGSGSFGLAAQHSGNGGKSSTNGADMPGTEGGSGHGTIGVGTGNGLRVASGGSAFGGIGGLLRGEPARTSGDGRAGVNGHGLSAEIYEGKPYLTKLVHRRTDAVIDFDWGNRAAIIAGVSRTFSVRWTGQIVPKYSETYTLESQEDDGFKIWIDGKLMINDWNDHKTATRTCKIPMVAGHQYTVRIDYFENGIGAAEVHLYWSSPSQPRQVVPESALLQAQ